MAIRWKLNLAVITLTTIFLVTAGFALRAVRENAAHASTYSRLRELAELTSGIHTAIYRHVATFHGVIGAPDAPDPLGWLGYAVRDIDIQTRLAESEEERELWSSLRRALTALGGSNAHSRETLSLGEAVELAERSLGGLRSICRLAEYASLETAAEKTLRAQQAI
ncbi:MAG: hypothetical protein IIC82_10165 [Chloroflexi bacterium]|nr:hypothetical protein [Chloroflexota bacterium]